MSLKGLALVPSLVYAVLPHFYDAYKQWLVQSGRTSVTFLPVERAAEQQIGNNELGEINESLYEYSSSAIVEVRD